MNKARVDSLLSKACKALEVFGIANEKKQVDSAFKGQIASFGATVSMGSIKAAVAAFSVEGKEGKPTEPKENAATSDENVVEAEKETKKPSKCKVNKESLMRAIYYLLNDVDVKNVKRTSLFNEIKDRPYIELHSIKEDILCAAIALKLAMNLYEVIITDESN